MIRSLTLILAVALILSFRASGEDRTDRLVHYGKAAAEAYFSGEPLPQLSNMVPEATVEEALIAQKTYVRELLQTHLIMGFKGAVVSAAGQERMALDAPLSAVLFASGWLESTQFPTVTIRTGAEPGIETEIGIILNEGISETLPDVESLKQKVRALVAVIELPASRQEWTQPPSAADITAINVGSDYYIVGPRIEDLDIEIDQIPIKLKHNDELINETSGGEANRGQWWNFLHQVNHAVEQGYSPEEGYLIISGALGKINRTGAGQYHANFGKLGIIDFTLTQP